MNSFANLVPPSGSFASFLNGWFFSLGGAFWILALVMVCIALVSYLTKQLTIGGALSSLLVGFGTTWVLGFGALFSLMLFFIAAGVLGVIGRGRKAKETSKIQKKGGCRDSMQVFANGGMALLCALLYALSPSMITLVMFGTAIAEAASDTFAGEVGILSKSKPVSIITGKPMAPGLSGAVSTLGSVAGLLGSFLVALCWLGNFLPLSGKNIAYASVITLGGFAGCLFDSILGATVQAHYFDEKSDLLTEHRYLHGKQLPLARGIHWVDNDMVNLISNIFGAILSGALALVIG
ncbi:putative membrane protein [Sphaerochaeta pleomorpha str. Grapes]|uniref:Putative membrane protein n=1 Tax=Sphaerochaeta pleomorpha (strain ATCC BAA-1885 / DSM 22778 / Grapes) TaxID=158190 RepID=G8QR20_SPHPG|nr:DUF92 domain-containing protein [Sphaerochaeta pleomorpha]AEV29868.1 putative membrane protein [Sphaerochaeta pleomorpha str. Grapes]